MGQCFWNKNVLFSFKKKIFFWSHFWKEKSFQKRFRECIFWRGHMKKRCSRCLRRKEGVTRRIMCFPFFLQKSFFPSISKKHPSSISKKHPFFEPGCFFEIEPGCFFEIEPRCFLITFLEQKKCFGKKLLIQKCIFWGVVEHKKGVYKTLFFI